MKLKLLLILSLAVLFYSCTIETKSKSENPTKEFHNKAHQLVYEMTQKVGTYNKLLNLKDVEYTYSYLTADGKEDITIEKYIFSGEKSYGKYIKHERTLPDIDGTIEQGFDGENFWFRINGEYSNDQEIMDRVIFNRKTNFYWFTMMQKLADPGLNYAYRGERKVNNKMYDLIKVTFEDQSKPTDIYLLYINQKTHLVDQFLFTVADYGKVEVPFLMKVKYENINGILIPSERKYTAATWQGKPLNDDWTIVKWENIKFNTQIPSELFEKVE